MLGSTISHELLAFGRSLINHTEVKYEYVMITTRMAKRHGLWITNLPAIISISGYSNDLGFRVLGFRVLGSRVSVLGVRVQGFRV